MLSKLAFLPTDMMCKGEENSLTPRLGAPARLLHTRPGRYAEQWTGDQLQAAQPPSLPALEPVRV